MYDTFTELEPDFFCENSVLKALYSLTTFSYAKEISELVETATAYRAQLLIILGKIGHPRYAYFIAKFADKEPLAVAQALGEIKQPSGIPVLLRLLESSNESVRWTASQSLVLIKGERVMDGVKLRLRYPNQDVVVIAARTLAVLGVADGLPVLRNLCIKKAPRILGHEITGDIVEIGKNIRKYKVDDRVFVSHHVPCYICSFCLNDQQTLCRTLHSTNFYPGGFAEYLRVPEINIDRGVFVLPKEISYTEGVFIEPLACVVRGLIKAGMKPAQTILIIGSGISGLLHIKLAKAWNAGKILATDVEEF